MSFFISPEDAGHKSTEVAGPVTLMPIAGLPAPPDYFVKEGRMIAIARLKAAADLITLRTVLDTIIEARRKAPLEHKFGDHLAFPLEVRLDYLIACKEWQGALDVIDCRAGDNAQRLNKNSSSTCFVPAAQPVLYFAS